MKRWTIKDKIMTSFEIMFDDLTPAAQDAYLEASGLECAADGNFDCSPIAIVDFENESGGE